MAHQEDGRGGPSERDGLMPDDLGPGYGAVDSEDGQTKGRRRPLSFMPLIFAIAITAIVTGLLVYISTNSINSDAHESIRREWAKEENHRATIREAWNVEIKGHEALRVQMNHEAVVWEGRVAEREPRWENERVAMDDERGRWAKEREEQRKWREEQKREDERKKAEEEERERQRQDKRRQEDEKRRNEEEEKEWQRQDEDDKKRSQMLWEDLEAAPQCLRYGTREYSATLFHVPVGFDSFAECRRKPIEIHGKQVLPTSCDSEEHGSCGRVKGHWTINFNEASCTPSWKYINDKGCDQNKHHYEGPIENLPNENWQEICQTTPAVINGVKYDGPTSCIDYGMWSGKWGLWFIDDPQCSSNASLNQTTVVQTILGV